MVRNRNGDPRGGHSRCARPCRRDRGRRPLGLVLTGSGDRDAVPSRPGASSLRNRSVDDIAAARTMPRFPPGHHARAKQRAVGTATNSRALDAGNCRRAGVWACETTQHSSQSPDGHGGRLAARPRASPSTSSGTRFSTPWTQPRFPPGRSLALGLHPDGSRGSPSIIRHASVPTPLGGCAAAEAIHPPRMPLAGRRPMGCHPAVRKGWPPRQKDMGWILPDTTARGSRSGGWHRKRRECLAGLAHAASHVFVSAKRSPATLVL